MIFVGSIVYQIHLSGISHLQFQIHLLKNTKVIFSIENISEIFRAQKLHSSRQSGVAMYSKQNLLFSNGTRIDNNL